jgi:DNA-binding transcriptional regulator GbsR (MarR family)
MFLNLYYFHEIVKTVNSNRDADRLALSGFIASFAAALVEVGFPRMPARVFVALLATDSGRRTSAELADLLKVSPAAISGAVRYLIQVNLLSRESEPGSRRDLFRVHDDVWYEAITRRDQMLTRLERKLREGIEVLGRDTPAGARMAETLEFFEFLQKELPMLLEKWRARKAELRRLGAASARPVVRTRSVFRAQKITG